MLNRLFIAIGVLVILAIGAAFIVPRFVQWGDYRGRMEELASGAVGAPVKITGDIQFSLLPAPVLQFSDVVVGDPANPAVRVRRVEAEFSLLDFLRDQYRVTRLELGAPEITVTVTKDGAIETGMALAGTSVAANLSIAEARIDGGKLTLNDQRAGTSVETGDISGKLQLETLRGPFTFQGSGSYDGASYGVRLSSGKADESGATPMSLFVKADDERFSLSVDGALASGDKPKFAGTLSYRQPPPKAAEGVVADAGRGDLVLEGRLEADAARVLLAAATMTPDENRPGTRLTGAADISLGTKPQFNVVASGGVIALPPRDATAELTDPPYELVRILGELPAPILPAMEGRLSLDAAELNLRGFSLRGIQIDAEAKADGWHVTSAVATLPGGGRLQLAGVLKDDNGKPAFNGQLTAGAERLDLLAQSWRRAPAANPLFNLPGSISGDVTLSGDTFAIAGGQLKVGDMVESFDAAIGLSAAARSLRLQANLGTLDDAQSQALAALLPEITGSGSFGATFPRGEVTLDAEGATIFGVAGRGLHVSADWDGGVLTVSRLAAADFGGAELDGNFTAFGTLTKPELSGAGSIKIADAGAPVLAALFTEMATPDSMQQAIVRQLPAELTLTLDAPTGEGAQTLGASGTVGAARLNFSARLGAGVVALLDAPINGTLELVSDTPHLLAAQLGLGASPIFPDGHPLSFIAEFDGAPRNSVETTLSLKGGSDSIQFAGNIVASDPSHLTGRGVVQASLEAPAEALAALGAGGVYLPSLSGKAALAFSGAERFELTDIAGEAGGATVSGELSMVRNETGAAVSGALALPALDARALLPLFAGNVGMGSGIWPETPLTIGDMARVTTGRVAISADALTAGGAPFLSAARFDLDWDKDSLRIRGLEGEAGGGRVTFDAVVCCTGALLDKRLNGRLTVNGVDLDAIVPAPIAIALNGKVDASAQFDGTGNSLSAIMSAMTGSGSYTVTDFAAEHLDPNAFTEGAGIQNVVDLAPEVLSAQIAEAVGSGAFTAPLLTGSFTVAGGVLRSPNLAIDGPAARIFGSGSVRLPDLTLSGRYTMTPVAIVTAATGIDTATAEISVDISGPLWAPVARLDLATLADGMKILASEVELARLEQLRAEEEARQKAAAEERARIAAELAAQDAARKAAEEEAARKAAEEEALRDALTPTDIGI